MEDPREILEVRLRLVEERLGTAAARRGCSAGDIAILAASKKQSPEAMNALAACLARRGRKPIFGESYLQDFLKKQAQLSPPFEAHMIGPLQSNKVREAVKCFDVIESIHSEKIATLADKAAAEAGKKQKIFMQVNISGDPAKSGFSPGQLQAFLPICFERFSNLEIRGLMTITRNYADPRDARADFHAMDELKKEILRSLPGSFAGQHLELSMGMSDDFDIAIEEGATLVRIGTALFGERPAR